MLWISMSDSTFTKYHGPGPSLLSQRWSRTPSNTPISPDFLQSSVLCNVGLKESRDPISNSSSCSPSHIYVLSCSNVGVIFSYRSSSYSFAHVINMWKHVCVLILSSIPIPLQTFPALPSSSFLCWMKALSCTYNHSFILVLILLMPPFCPFYFSWPTNAKKFEYV